MNATRCSIWDSRMMSNSSSVRCPERGQMRRMEVLRELPQLQRHHRAPLPPLRARNPCRLCCSPRPCLRGSRMCPASTCAPTGRASISWETPRSMPMRTSRTMRSHAVSFASTQRNHVCASLGTTNRTLIVVCLLFAVCPDWSERNSVLGEVIQVYGGAKVSCRSPIALLLLFPHLAFSSSLSSVIARHQCLTPPSFVCTAVL